MPRSRRMPASGIASIASRSTVIARLGELGLMGVCVPEEYGGAGAGFLAYVLVLEELSRADAGIGVSVAVHTSAATLPVLAWGTKEQCERLVPSLASGSTLGAFALTEPDAGSDAAALRTAAKRDGDGWLLSGQKQWVTNGGHAGHILAFARTNPEVEGGDGISAFLLEASHVTVTREEEKLGLNSSSTADLLLENARVDGDRLLGEEGRGFAIALDALDGGRIGIAAQAVGIAQAAYDAARAYAVERKAFGRRLADHQAIEAKLVNMAVEIEAARLLTYRAAWLKEHGLAPQGRGGEGEALRLGDGPPPDGRGDPGARRLRVHEGVPCRALLPRREDHGDLRGDERDPADRDRALDPRDGRVSPRDPQEPVRLTKIYTRGGDRGETSLGDGSRVSKLHPRVAANGDVDELNSLVGWTIVVADGRIHDVLVRVQNELFDVGADITVPSTKDALRVTQEQVDRLEADCDAFNAELAPLKSFVLPGGTELAARLFLARAVCRRAERSVLAADVGVLPAVYLNRLSDLLFILARSANLGTDEPLWKPGSS